MTWLLSGEGSFGAQHFGGCQLGDRRRTRRLVELADLLHKHPGGTLPHKLGDPKDLKAFYRLVNKDEVTHATMLACHRRRTAAKIEEAGRQGKVVLLIHDTTELDFTTHYSLDDLGKIGNGDVHRGYLCHNSLAVLAGSREAIGLTSQILHRRPLGKKKKQSVAQRRRAQERESRLWLEGIEQSGPVSAGATVIDVCDRGADTFEFLQHEQRRGRRFIIRSSHNRKLAGREKKYLHREARRWRPLGTFAFEVKPSLARSGRQTTLAVAAAAVTLAAPQERRGEHDGEAIPLWVVRVWEENTPDNEPPFEWILLTSETAASFEQAKTVADHYAHRPLIEEFHKAQKTGCEIENMQFTTLARLEPAIALISVVALTLLSLREAARRPDAKTRKATELLHQDYVIVLSQWRHGKTNLQWSIHDFYYALGRLGGHQNRRRDGAPGWITLWRGWTTLQAMVKGAEAERRHVRRCG